MRRAGLGHVATSAVVEVVVVEVAALPTVAVVEVVVVEVAALPTVAVVEVVVVEAGVVGRGDGHHAGGVAWCPSLVGGQYLGGAPAAIGDAALSIRPGCDWPAAASCPQLPRADAGTAAPSVVQTGARSSMPSVTYWDDVGTVITCASGMLITDGGDAAEPVTGA